MSHPAPADSSLLVSVRASADRLLGLLLVAHLPLALIVAAFTGTWALAILIGGPTSACALYLTRRRPGTLLTRLFVAAAFMTYSALLIQQAGGLVEMHFHIFAAMAFLLLYRDWRVPVCAAAIIAVHHLGFDVLQGMSLPFRVTAESASFGIILLHAGFVVFETAVLVVLSVGLERETVDLSHRLEREERERAALLALAQGLERRDLAAGETSSEETTIAVAALRQGIGNVAELVRAIQHATAGMASGADRLASVSADAERATVEVTRSVGEVASGTERQALSMRAAKSSMHHVVDAVRSSAASAKETVAAASGTREIVEHGAAAADRATAAVRNAERSSTTVSATIDELSTKSGQIAEFLHTISAIADQTNLLALNAAIEAARAGEAGRGFAVVAEEVRKLADESQRATGLIGRLIQEIQSDVASAVTAVAEGGRSTAEGVAIVEEAREAFVRIGISVKGMSVLIEQIATVSEQAAGEASSAGDEMDEAVHVAEESAAATQQVSASTGETLASTQELAASAQELSAGAAVLQRLVVEFSVAERATDATGEPDAPVPTTA